MVVHASAAEGKSPYGPELLLGLGVDDGVPVAGADDDGALTASGAEHAVSARAAKRTAAVRGRERFFKGHSSA
jgi:hypothetical protein